MNENFPFKMQTPLWNQSVTHNDHVISQDCFLLHLDDIRHFDWMKQGPLGACTGEAVFVRHHWETIDEFFSWGEREVSRK